MLLDFRSEYGIDLVDLLAQVQSGRATPRLVILYVRGLPDTSRYHALRQGGLQFWGWGQDRILAADHFDMAAAASRAYEKPPTYPRPEKPTPKPEKGRGRLHDLFAMFGGSGRR